MKRQALVGCIALLPILANACNKTEPSSEPTLGKAREGLTATPLPIPCAFRAATNTVEPTFNGTPAQLAVADALVACSYANGAPVNGDPAYDTYLLEVLRDLISVEETSYCSPQDKCYGKNAFERWAAMRADYNYSCDSSGHQHTGGVRLDADPPRVAVMNGFDPATQQSMAAVSAATMDILAASRNLCMALRLRELSPGASGSAALFFTEADQRELLEVVRERSQLAMIQYGLLAEAFAVDLAPPLPNTVDEHARLSLLHQWAVDPRDGLTQLTAMGDDFAAAVQLHAFVSKELAELLGRSASARSPITPHNAGSPADFLWGTGSWKQRLLALGYGGDPLAIRPGGSWTSFASVPGTTTNLDWPTATELPYARTALDQPEILELLGLAQRFDTLSLLTSPATAGGCPVFDTAATAASIYANTETALRLADCAYAPSGGSPCPTVYPPVIGTDTKNVLWTKYRITPAHALALATFLTEAVGPTAFGACTSPPSDARFGAMDVISSQGVVPALTVRGSSVHIAPDAAFVRRASEEVGPLFTRNARLRLPDPAELLPSGIVSDVGFTLTGGFTMIDPGAEVKRTFGALAAQAATREMLTKTVAYLQGSGNTSLLNTYLSKASRMVDVLGGASGATSTSIRPMITSAAGQYAPLLQNGTPLYTVSILHPTDDAFWEPACAGCATAFYVALLNGPLASNLARDAHTTIYGSNVSDLLSAAIRTGQYGLGTTGPSVPGFPSVLTATNIPVAAPGEFTIALVKTTGGGSGIAGARTVRLLAGNVRVDDVSDIKTNGQYIATGGSLGSWIDRQYEVAATNPSEPSYDGFDMHVHWVPPLDASLGGGAAPDGSAQYYMDLAQRAAVDATEAIQTALDGLVQESQDATAFRAATVKAANGIKADRDGLCGPANQSCTIQVVNRSPDPSWYPALTDCQGSDAKCAVDHLAFIQLDGLLRTKFDMAQDVVDAMNSDAPPTFEAYSGGTLQSALIEQWRALRAPNEKLGAIAATASAVKAQIDTARAALDLASEEIKRACEPEATALAVAAGMSGGIFSVGFSPGPLIAQMEKCAALKRAMPLDNQKAVQALADAFATMGSASTGLTDAQAQMTQAAAKVASLVNQAHIADAQQTLEASLTQDALASANPVYRRYRSYDVWRARALLESSRQYALTARRAIEARYMVDLSKMADNESFVVAPAVWADEVYDYDLSLPAAVGLSVGTPVAGGIYANKIKDYVNNLRAFVSGYAIARSSAVAKSEINVVSLQGLKPGTPVSVGVPPVLVYGDLGRWSLHCASGWIAVPANAAVDTPCVDSVGNLVAADRARLEFTLDPWGRWNGSIANEPFVRRFNVRWSELAVNFVGTSVKDCSKAADPSGCYSSNFIPYNLSHVGPAWVTDYDEIWRQLDVPRGQVEGAKGIASEIWLDPLKDGWSTPYISAVARSEFEVRPLGGAYELEFPVGPEVVLSHIERVQLLVGSSAWVKQN